jgi:hypothetical protein
MSGKKAQTQVQFQWVFVLIAGAIILAFFVSLSVWYKSSQELKLEDTVVLKLKSLFTTAMESPRTAMPLQIPEMNLKFSCDFLSCRGHSCASEFSGGGVSSAIETDVLFAHTNLKSNMLVTWSLPWAVPFPVTNFLYVTNDKMRYILIHSLNPDDIRLAGLVNDELQQNSYLNKQFISQEELNSLENFNEDFVRIVYFGNNLPSSLRAELDALYAGNDFDILQVYWDEALNGPGNANENTGDLLFEGETSPMYYAGIPQLIGAIFSPSGPVYQCNMFKTVFKLLTVAKNYRNAAEYYTLELPEDKVYCGSYYETMIASLETIMLEAGGDVDFEAIGPEILNLRDTNNNLVIKDCPRLF